MYLFSFLLEKHEFKAIYLKQSIYVHGRTNYMYITVYIYSFTGIDLFRLHCPLAEQIKFKLLSSRCCCPRATAKSLQICSDK